MTPKPLYTHYLKDIQINADLAISFCEGLDLSSFAADTRTSMAVIRALEVIGEAAKNVPPEIQMQYSTVAWKPMSRMRDKLIHHYFGIDLEVVWRTVQEDLPVLRKEISLILSELNID